MGAIQQQQSWRAARPLVEQLIGLESIASAKLGGLDIELQPIPGEVPVIQVSVEGRAELPIYITCSDSQVLCICYLWTESEIAADRRVELMETLLGLNMSVPLSAFGKVGERYVLYGALGRDARVEDIAHDVAALSDNAIDALEALGEYLN